MPSKEEFLISASAIEPSVLTRFNASSHLAFSAKNLRFMIVLSYMFMQPVSPLESLNTILLSSCKISMNSIFQSFNKLS